MSVFCEFFKHKDFGGDLRTYTLDNSWRYWWIKFGSPLKNEVSSFRARAYGGMNGNVYGFTQNNFLGDFAALNIPEGSTSWWSYVGGALNDDIESALLINRNKTEFEIEIKDQLSNDFKTAFDAGAEGTQVKRNGDPQIYSLFWPSHDPSRKFIRINQKLRVEVDWWPDYDARVKYDIYLYLNSSGQVAGFTAWTTTWVEGGIFSGDILDRLHPKMIEGAGVLTAKLQEKLAMVNLLALLAGYDFQQLYLLPGKKPVMPPPNSNFGRIGTAKEDSTVVISYA